MNVAALAALQSWPPPCGDYVIKHLDAGRVALIMLVTPVSALLLGQTLNAEFIPASGCV